MLNILILILVVVIGAIIRLFGDPDLIGVITAVSGLALPLGMLVLLVVKRKSEKSEQHSTDTKIDE